MKYSARHEFHLFAEMRIGEKFWRKNLFHLFAKMQIGEVSGLISIVRYDTIPSVNA